MALRTGFRAIEEQRALLAPDHPLQSYLCISQLSIAKNWKDLVDAMVAQLKQGSSPKLADYKRDWTQEMGTLNQQLVPVFAALKASLGENGHGLYVRWKQAHADVPGI
jgi:hypothetical protein